MMAKLFGVPQWKRFVGGVLLGLFGLSLIVADVVTAYRASQQPHPLMIGVGVLIGWFGGAIVDAKWMVETSRELVSILAAIVPLLKLIAQRGGNGDDSRYPGSTSPAALSDPNSARPTGPPPPPPPPGT